MFLINEPHIKKEIMSKEKYIRFKNCNMIYKERKRAVTNFV